MTRINAMLERRKDDSGFTLIELMVVVLIIGILIAIAIPTFLGARARAQNRAAQSSLRNAITAAKTIYTDKEDYTQATVSVKDCSAAAAYADHLHCSEPSLTFLGDATTAVTTAQAPNTISVDAPDAQHFFAAAMAGNGTCWFVEDDVAQGEALAGTHWGTSTTAANCNSAYMAGHLPAATATDPSSASSI